MTVPILWRRSMLLLYSMHTAFAYSQNVSANVSSSLSGARETSLSESTLLLSTTPSPGLELIPTANPDRPQLEVTTVEGDEGGVMFTNPAEATARVSMNMPHIESSRSDPLNAADRATASQTDIPQITTPPLIIGPELFAPIDGGIGGYANNEHALLPGGPAVILTLTRPVTTVVTLSLASDASQVFINGKPTSLSPQPQQNQRFTAQLPILTINGYILTPLAHPTTLPNSPNENQSDSPTAYILPDGQTLLPGATVLFQGTPISLAPGLLNLSLARVRATLCWRWKRFKILVDKRLGLQ